MPTHSEMVPTKRATGGDVSPKDILSGLVSSLFYLPAILSHILGRKNLERTPEPAPLSNEITQVHEYDRVLQTRLVIFYAVALELIDRVNPHRGKALDLACGPGHFTLHLGRHLGFEEVLGLDLAPNMIACCQNKAEKANDRTKYRFEVADITSLDNVPDESVSLASFTDAAHHLPTLDDVTKTVAEMDRITAAHGLILIMDVGRLGNRIATDLFVKTAGRGYHRNNLATFYDDFHKSMYAAWTMEDLLQCVPSGSHRSWLQFAPPGLPAVQYLLGLPKGKAQEALCRRSDLWKREASPVPQAMRGEWLFTRFLVNTAIRHAIKSPLSNRT